MQVSCNCSMVSNRFAFSFSFRPIEDILKVYAKLTCSYIDHGCHIIKLSCVYFVFRIYKNHIPLLLKDDIEGRFLDVLSQNLVWYINLKVIFYRCLSFGSKENRKERKMQNLAPIILFLHCY